MMGIDQDQENSARSSGSGGCASAPTTTDDTPMQVSGVVSESEETTKPVVPVAVPNDAGARRIYSAHRRPPASQSYGRWTDAEHEAFLEGVKLFGRRRWKKISTLIPTRTIGQVRSHAQKYFAKLDAAQGDEASVVQRTRSASFSIRSVDSKEEPSPSFSIARQNLSPDEDDEEDCEERREAAFALSGLLMRHVPTAADALSSISEKPPTESTSLGSKEVPTQGLTSEAIESARLAAVAKHLGSLPGHNSPSDADQMEDEDREPETDTSDTTEPSIPDFPKSMDTFPLNEMDDGSDATPASTHQEHQKKQDQQGKDDQAFPFTGDDRPQNSDESASKETTAHAETNASSMTTPITNIPISQNANVKISAISEEAPRTSSLADRLPQEQQISNSLTLAAFPLIAARPRPMSQPPQFLASAASNNLSTFRRPSHGFILQQPILSVSAPPCTSSMLPTTPMSVVSGATGVIAKARSLVRFSANVSSLFEMQNVANGDLQGGKRGDTKDIISPNGPVFATARIAGIMAAKRASEFIPMCNFQPLDRVHVDIKCEGNSAVIECECSSLQKSSVGTEALTGASVTALTICDMLKHSSVSINIEQTTLLGSNKPGPSQAGNSSQ